MPSRPINDHRAARLPEASETATVVRPSTAYGVRAMT